MLFRRIVRSYSERLQRRIDAAARPTELRVERLEQEGARGNAELGDRICALEREALALHHDVDGLADHLPLLVTALSRRLASAREAGTLRPRTSPRREGPLRIAIYAGVYLPADGISASVRPKLEMIRALRDSGVPIEVTVFTQVSEGDADPEVVTLSSLEGLLGHPAFQAADLHIFEFGHFYELFDAALAVPEWALITAVYHNITPAELSTDPVFQRRIRRSLVQKHNLFLAERILCVSQYNRDDLVRFGIPAERLAVVATPPAVVPPPRQPRQDGPVELLFVGRIIPAKGVLDLVRAVAGVVRGGLTDLRLTIAGNAALSSADCLDEIQQMVEAESLQDHVRVVHPGDAELGRLYARSDVLVMPSYHEGFCVPVIEALSAQCHVIASDAGNLPVTLGGLGTLVPAGDVAALGRAIADLAERLETARHSGMPMEVPTVDGSLSEDVWRRRAAEHVERHSLAAFERGFGDLLAWAAEATGRGSVADAIRRWTEEARYSGLEPPAPVLDRHRT